MEDVWECVCRVCLRKDNGSVKCLSLFESYEDSSVSEHIVCIARIEIKEGDGLPERICPDCLLQLSTALAFKRKCQTSDKLLREVQLIQIPIEYDDKSEISVKEETEIDVNNESDHLCTEYSDPQLQSDIETNTVIRKSRSIDLKLTCNDCQGTFKSKCKLRVHWKKAHLADKLTCPTCKRIFSTFKAFNKHVKQKSRSCMAATELHIEGQGKSRVFYCKHCPFKNKKIEAFKSHILIHTGEKPFECNKCDKRFTQLSSLLGHKEVHHNEYRLESTCHICGKYFKGRKRITDHMRTHKLTRVKCDVCNLSLKNRSSLLQHMKRHSGVKSFSCESCPLRFYTSAELITHRRKVHLRHRHKYKCDMCEYSVDQNDAFIKHKSRHTGTNVPCLICGSFFDNAQKLETHKKLHLENKYVCPHCGNKYATNRSRKSHISKKHQEFKSNIKKKKINGDCLEDAQDNSDKKHVVSS